MPQRNNPERETPVFSASKVLETVGNDLALIKSQDRLTYADLAAILGKSEDQAAKYCEGTAEMGVVAFARAWREWNGRFAGGLAALCHDSRPNKHCDRVRQSRVLEAALALSVALEDDGEVRPSEVRDNLPALEAARDALDELIRRRVQRA
ncbi:hypothetical protein EGM87_22705 [Sphingobium sp. RSMS]|uniref:hypothetical protein n=1 Tax=Sphingobium sp. RSMS TaxID=520734 RepID=UPI0010F65A7C|nr:hypothetical protein [Sphingobium sp. RSMS]UXC93110.1 hypothetical protein EGM87_22705 [Sphingobium sp. RSMS]